MIEKIDIDEIKKTLADLDPLTTKIYLGADSERIIANGKAYADYMLVVAIHKNGKNGCKLYGEVIRELDWDQKKSKPSMRLMNEAYKIGELFNTIKDSLEGFDVEIHLDLNPDERYASSKVIENAIGYIRGTCNVIPMVKPSAFCASIAADRLKQLNAQ